MDRERQQNAPGAAKAIQEFEEYKKYSEAYAEAARRTKVTYSDYLKAFKAGETRLGYDEWKQPYIQQELFKIQYPDIAAARERRRSGLQTNSGAASPRSSRSPQTIAGEGYTGATAKYGRDPQAMIADLTAQAEATQRSLRENFGVEVDPSHVDYLRDISKFAAGQRQTSASIQRTARRSGIVDQDTGLRIVSAGPPLKTSDYPAPPAAAATTEPSPLGAYTREHMLPWTPPLFLLLFSPLSLPPHEFFSKGLFESAAPPCRPCPHCCKTRREYHKGRHPRSRSRPLYRIRERRVYRPPGGS